MFHYLNRMAILVTTKGFHRAFWLTAILAMVIFLSSLVQAQGIALPPNLEKIKANFDILSRTEGRHSLEVEDAARSQIIQDSPRYTPDEVLFLIRYIQERLAATHSIQRTDIFRAVYEFSLTLKQKLGPIGPILLQVLKESPDQNHIRVRTLIYHINDNVGQHPMVHMPDVYETGNIQNLSALSILVLIESLGNYGPNRGAYYRELTKRGEEAIPFLKQALVNSENYEVQLSAARAFGDILFQLPPQARFGFYSELIQPLIRLLRIESRDLETTWIGQALAAFYEAEPSNAIFTPALIAVIKQSENVMSPLHTFKLSESYLNSVKKSVGCELILEEPRAI